MTHEELRDRLLDLAYGELSKRDARKVEAHAASCEACGAELARIRGTRRIMTALPPEPAPAEGERILLAAAREAAGARAPRRRLPAWLWGGGIAAVSAAAVIAVSYRLLELRPGPLDGDRRDVLLGDSPYARAPSPAPVPEESAPATRALPDDRASTARDDRGVAPAPPRAPPRAAAAPAAPRPERARPPDAAPRRDEAPPPAAAEEPAETRAHSTAAAEGAPPAAAAPTPGRAPPAPAADAPRSASKASRRAPPGEAAAGRAAAEPGNGDALARYAELRDAGRLRGEIRTFPRCEGEAWRKVETDPRGRVVKYVREGRIGGRRLRIEHVYGEAGALSAATVRDLDEPGAAVDADALGLALPAQAREAAIDAPPRCGPERP